MGFAIAAEAMRRGADVTLIAGPTTVEPPPVRELVRVRSAVEMHEAVMHRADQAAVVVMAAAVADYAPESRAAQKVAKQGDTITLTLKKNPDILADLGQRRLAAGGGPLLVGFAAETQDVVPSAAAKRLRKKADVIVANDVSRTDAGFEVDWNAVTIVDAQGAESIPLQSKSGVASAILNHIERLLTWTATTSKNT
jgi:phosphopantothenoylcysteine decarboxylase/phosphopantothenate--cysteine ligase